MQTLAQDAREGEALIVANGIDAVSGRYLTPPMQTRAVAKIAQGERLDPQELRELEWRVRQASEAHLGVKEGVDANDLADAGWGVIFSHDADPAIREALGGLLEHRRAQAGKRSERRYRELSGACGYRPGESKDRFLARHGAGPGPVNPDKFPYYLLIVGSPESIPYRFQYELDVMYAVGRVCFEQIEDYARYAQNVIAAETGDTCAARRLELFGVSNPADRATQLSTKHLMEPLAASLSSASSPDWTVQSSLREAATKSRLTELLRGTEPPALLFTASHGMSFPDGDARQPSQQGALLCQDWPGPLKHRGPIARDHYFCAEDLSVESGMAPWISFHFACYGLGTPQFDDFAHRAFGERTSIAPHAFVSALPQKLLTLRGRGALAVVGHVERAWGYSFLWGRAGEQLTVFESALTCLMRGQRVGAALEYFNQRHADLAVGLSMELEDLRFGKEPDDEALAGMWTATSDARNYAILGDPAVRLPIDGDVHAH